MVEYGRFSIGITFYSVQLKNRSCYSNIMTSYVRTIRVRITLTYYNILFLPPVYNALYIACPVQGRSCFQNNSKVWGDKKKLPKFSSRTTAARQFIPTYYSC